MICSREVPSQFLDESQNPERKVESLSNNKERGTNGRRGIAFKAQGQPKVKSL